MDLKKCLYEVVIIGGGAAGMMAGIAASNFGATSICILEKNDSMGKKLLATGNGRCNITNVNAIGAGDTLLFFQHLGLETREEAEGRIYPYSEQASSVLNILLYKLKDQGIKIQLKSLVTEVNYDKDVFQILLSNGSVVQGKKLIIATGGKAGPQFGSTGDGYGFGKKLGHTLKRTMPSLVQMVSPFEWFKQLKGVRTKGVVTLFRNGSAVDCEKGEIQFTADGISGICVLNLSKNYEKGDWVRLDLFPEYTEDDLNVRLAERKQWIGNRNLIDFFEGTIHKKLIPVLIERLGFSEQRLASTLESEEIQKISKILKQWDIIIDGTKGWKEAQVTAGGILLDEIQENSMESRILSGLYFAGEVVDIDEKCGGYNLQWAWHSGYAAGSAAAQKVRNEHAQNT